MRSRKSICALTLIALLWVQALPLASAPLTLEDVLQRMDQEAKRFKSLTASVERTKVTVVVNDHSTESGEIYVRHDGKMRLDLTNPDPRTILRSGENIYVFNPRIKHVEEYNLSKHRELVDEFLMLGFGTPGHALKKSYLITPLGEETLDDKKVVKLELTPKSEKVRGQISKIHLWLDEGTWLPAQQKFFETGTEDYFVIRYTNIVRNGGIPDSRFKPDWPKGTKRIKPEG